MKHIAILLCIVVCTVAELAATSLYDDIPVGGDVPRPGPVAFDDNGMTIESIVAKAWLDLRQFYKGADSGVQACPIRVVLYRDGKRKIYDPGSDADVLRTEKVHRLDAIEVKDFRKYQGKIEESVRRINQMISLGSSEVGDEILELAALRHEYTQWKRSSSGDEPDTVESFTKKEVARLTDEGESFKMIGILDLRRSALEREGLAPAHPKVKETIRLKAMFIELQQKAK
jgi:hypothetical protein